MSWYRAEAVIVGLVGFFVSAVILGLMALGVAANNHADDVHLQRLREKRLACQSIEAPAARAACAAVVAK